METVIVTAISDLGNPERDLKTIDRCGSYRITLNSGTEMFLRHMQSQWWVRWED